MLMTIEKAKQKITSGEILMVAGDENLLAQLPKGNWIGGSIPYFIAENGGIFTKDQVFVTTLDPKIFSAPAAQSYTEKSITAIATNAPENSLTFLIIPFGSAVHQSYAQNAPDFADMFQKPIIGWISGMALADIGKVKACVVNGLTGEKFTDQAMALRCKLPAGRQASISIINIFKQGNGDNIEFQTEGFDIKEAIINGQKQNFYQYIKANKIDTQLPLVGDFGGALINVSYQSLDDAAQIVHLYAPVFKNMVYKMAAPIGNYTELMQQKLSEFKSASTVFSCNCILNYLYGSLEGKRTGTVTGPITFGEIAYQLVNQTFVAVEV